MNGDKDIVRHNLKENHNGSDIRRYDLLTWQHVLQLATQALTLKNAYQMIKEPSLVEKPEENTKVAKRANYKNENKPLPILNPISL